MAGKTVNSILRVKVQQDKLSRAWLFVGLLAAMWLQASDAMEVKTPDHPIVLCGLSDNSIATRCRYGGYIINPDRNICKDRYVCHRGPGESCNDNVEMRCSPGLVCNCHICQNCIDENCKMELCPVDNTILKRWLNRFERNLLEYNA